ncbi:class E sortase [Streptomyces sp. NPDC092296]|uniref:class E sortase n=1 Tax=Streptomyces sp. NPDC092296 TaxID=3366012 RepID=UPI00381F2EDE
MTELRSERGAHDEYDRSGQDEEHSAAGRADTPLRDGDGTLMPRAAPGPTAGGRAARRREARRRRDGPGLIAVRLFGECLITLGLVLSLFVAYQLWWTNVRADDYADKTRSKLEQQWAGTGGKGKKHPPYPKSVPFGTRFAIIYIPKLDVKTPIAEGTDRDSILNNGLVGHYTGQQETAFPWTSPGNFALAAHRNTHGEPFRYINTLEPGDKVVVATAYDYYTYEVTKKLEQTPPTNVSVIEPIPPQSGFTRPGRYITLTTCTPDFHSTYRLVVWGKLIQDLPKSSGRQPSALQGKG